MVFIAQSQEYFVLIIIILCLVNSICFLHNRAVADGFQKISNRKTVYELCGTSNSEFEVEENHSKIMHKCLNKPYYSI